MEDGKAGVTILCWALGVHVNSLKDGKQQSTTLRGIFLRSQWRVISYSINHPTRAGISHEKTETHSAPPHLHRLHGA